MLILMKDTEIEKAKDVFLVDILERLGIPYKFIGSQACMICAFHDEYDGSMVLYDDHYHCFGCGEHGDGISLVKKLLGLSFQEAVELLNMIADGK